jgi:uncharacterized membrane protein YbaN (DUF454 family)
MPTDALVKTKPQRQSRVLPREHVPPQIGTCDMTLREFAGTLLRQPAVRSVVVERQRGEVLVNAAGEVPIHYDPAAVSVEVLAWSDPHQPLVYCIRAPKAVAGWQRAMFLFSGVVCTALAALGVVLPGLPTTPFVLLASYCLLRSSRQLHERLLRNRLFGGVLHDWYLHRGLRPHVRYKALAVLALVVAASVYWGGLPWWAEAVIIAIAVFGAVYVWRLPDVVE